MPRHLLGPLATLQRICSALSSPLSPLFETLHSCSIHHLSDVNDLPRVDSTQPAFQCLFRSQLHSGWASAHQKRISHPSFHRPAAKVPGRSQLSLYRTAFAWTSFNGLAACSRTPKSDPGPRDHRETRTRFPNAIRAIEELEKQPTRPWRALAMGLQQQ